MVQDEQSHNVEVPHRRAALKQIGVGLGVAWVTPVILASPALAAGTTCTSCGVNLLGTAPGGGSSGDADSYALTQVLNGAGGAPWSTSAGLNAVSVANSTFAGQQAFRAVTAASGPAQCEQTVAIPVPCQSLFNGKTATLSAELGRNGSVSSSQTCEVRALFNTGDVVVLTGNGTTIPVINARYSLTSGVSLTAAPTSVLITIRFVGTTAYRVDNISLSVAC